MELKVSKRRLNQARLLADKAAASLGILEAQALLNSYFAAAKAITNALQKEGAHVRGFSEWWSLKQDEMRGDELLRFIHVHREEVYHRAEEVITFALELTIGWEQPRGSTEPTPPIEKTPEGVFWVLETGTSNERRVPIPDDNRRVSFTIRDAPKSHLGLPIVGDIKTICSLSMAYYTELVTEADAKFSTEGSLPNA